MVEVVKRKPGRPRKERPIQILEGEGEQQTTVVRPVPDPEHDPNPVYVEQTDPVTDEVVAVYEDAGEAVELPDEAAIDRARELMAEATFEPSEFEVQVIDVPSMDETIAERAVLSELSRQQVAALDRDYDGQAGGSRPIAKLTDHQRSAWMMDAVDAYESQTEIKRSDPFNRVWTFRHEIYQNRDHMLIECRRGPTVARRLISTAVFSAGKAMVAIEEVDGEAAR